MGYVPDRERTADGVPLCAATNSQLWPAIASDGAGGAIVTWADSRSGWSGVYAQRVNASGVVQWAADGVALCSGTWPVLFPRISPDGSGGAILTWQDGRGADEDIYAQRVDASGVAQWTTNGVALCTAIMDQRRPVLDSDGGGGAVIAWEDNRSGVQHIYAQRVNASGAVQWAAGGVILGTATGSQWRGGIVSDGAGGCIVTWVDNGTYDVYAQRVDASGVAQWTEDGLTLCTGPGNHWGPNIVSDSAGGAIVPWEDTRSDAGDIYAQRVTHSGNIGTDHVPVSSMAALVIAVAAGSLGLRRLRRREVIGA